MKKEILYQRAFGVSSIYVVYHRIPESVTAEMTVLDLVYMQ